MDSEHNTLQPNRSPLQELFTVLISSVCPPEMLSMLTQLLPEGMGSAITDALGMLNDPILLHDTMVEVLAKVHGVIELDHTLGFGGPGICGCDSESTLSGVDTSTSEEASPSSLYSGHDRDGQVDSNGSTDEPVLDHLWNEE